MAVGLARTAVVERERDMMLGRPSRVLADDRSTADLIVEWWFCAYVSGIVEDMSASIGRVFTEKCLQVSRFQCLECFEEVIKKEVE